MHMLDSFRDRLDISPVQVAKTELDRLVGKKSQYAGGLLSVAYQFGPRAAAPEFLVGTLRLSGTRIKPRKTRRYPRLTLVDKWIGRRQVPGLLDANSDGVRFHGPQGDVLFDGSHGERRMTQDPLGSLSGRAETLIMFQRFSDQPTVIHVPAVGRGLPPFVTIVHAASDWCFGQGAHNPGDVLHRGQLCVIAPELRAYIAQVKIEDGQLSFELEAVAPGRFDVHVVFTGSYGLERTSIICQRQRDTRFECAVPKSAERVDIFAIAPGGELATHFRQWTSHLESASEESERRALEEEIAGGESDKVEFKPWPTKGDLTKVQEVVRTVVAFANTAGGRIYVGVDDTGEVQGLKLIAHLGQTPDAILNGAVKMIDREVRNAVRPTPPFHVSVASAQNGSIVIVEVDRGDQRPYHNAQSEIYVRRGATTRRPDPHSELPKLFSRNSND